MSRRHPPRGPDRRPRRGLLLAACAVAALGGCASRVEVRSLATGRAELAAYELRGAEPEDLLRTAQRLCPQGGEILHQAQRGRPSEPSTNVALRWARAAGDTLDPPQREAQLRLLCKDAPQAGWLAASASAAPAAVAAGSTATDTGAATSAGPQAVAATVADAGTPAAAVPPAAAPSASPPAPAAAASSAGLGATPAELPTSTPAKPAGPGATNAAARPAPTPAPAPAAPAPAAAPKQAPAPVPAPIGPLTVDW